MTQYYDTPQTVSQGAAGSIANAWPFKLTDGVNVAAINAFQELTVTATQSGAWSVAAVQSGSWSVGRTWTLASGTDSVAATQSGTWTVQAVQSGSWSVGRTWTLGSGTDSVAALQSGTWTVQAVQSGSWSVGRTWTLASGTDSVAATQSGTWTVQAVQSGSWSVGRTWTLASGTDSVAALQSGTWTVQPGNTANTTPWLTSISQGGNTASVTAANALKVDGSASPVNGRSKVLVARNDYSSINVTTGAYVQISASTAAAINRVYVGDTSGSAIILAVGAAGFEVDQLYIPPGGNDAPYELAIPAASRIAIKALDTNATSGSFILTALS